MFINLSKEKQSFFALVTTHFLTTLNDNLYKFLLVFFLLEGKGLADNAKALSYVGMSFALPFLLLAPLAGSLSDRYQKRNIILVTRVIEIICTAFGVFFFYIHSALGGYIVLILMACHTTVFGPAKMGILPEMMSLDYLSRANGIMTGATYVGSILGSCFAPLLVHATSRLPINGYVLSASFCVFASIVSFFVSLRIRPSNVKNRCQKINYISFKNLWTILKDARHVKYLTASIFLSSFFLLVGSYTQAEMIPFVEFTLGYPKYYGAYLFPLLALGVVSGSYIAGRMSGKDIKLAYVPITALGLGVLFVGFYVCSSSLIGVVCCLICIGFLGGVYQVPLHAYVQYASPEHQRGRILAANNFLDFFGVLVAAGLVRVMGSSLRLSPEASFSFLGVIIIGVGLCTMWAWRECVYRLLLGTALCKQLGGRIKLPRSIVPVCYFVSAHSYSEVRRVLAMLPKMVRSVVVILDVDLQPGWATRLVSYCVPTRVCLEEDAQDKGVQEAWAVLQANYLHALLRKQPDLCVICLGSEDRVKLFSEILTEQKITLHTITLSSEEDSSSGTIYRLSLNQ